MSDTARDRYPWVLESEDRLVYKADVRIEETDKWSSECEDVMNDGGYRGWMSNRGRWAIPWDQGPVLSLSVDQDHQAVLFVEYSPSENTGLPSAARSQDQSRSQFRAIPYRGYSVCGYSLSPDGRSVAVVEFWGGVHGALTVVDPLSGDRSLITRLDGLVGNEPPLWSPDGRSILVPMRAPIMVNLARSLVVPLGEGYPSGIYVDWWPGPDGVSVFGLAGAGLEQQVLRLNLSTGRWQDVSQVHVDPQPGLDASRHALAYPRMSPDGDAVLVGCPLGPESAYQEEYGSRRRLAILNPRTGDLQQIFSAFIDDTVVEREHDRWHWTSRSRVSGPIALAPDLLELARPVDDRDREDRDDLDDRREHLWGWWAGGIPEIAEPSIDAVVGLPRIASLSKPARVEPEPQAETVGPPPYARAFRIHADFPESNKAFDLARQAVTWMKDHGGYTFHGVLVDSRGQQLSPEWIDVGAGWATEDGTRCVLAGSLTHAALGLDEAYDLGTFDGRNLPFGGPGDWGPTPAESLAMPNQQVFIGDPRTGRFQMTHVGTDVKELAVSPDGRRYATRETQGLGPNYLYIADTDDYGPRRLLGSFDFAQDVSFSPNGQWLGLIAGGFALIDLASGRLARVPIRDGFTTGWDWWPDADPAIVQVVYDRDAAVNRLFRIDLRSGASEQLDEIRIDAPAQHAGSEFEGSLISPRVSPDGRWVLAKSRAFQSPGRESEYTERMGLVLVDLTTRETRPLHEAFIDGPEGPFGHNVLTIDHQDHVWIGRGDDAYPAVPSGLAMEDINRAGLSDEQRDGLGEDSLQVASLALERAIGTPRFSGPGPGALLPETVRYCESACATAAEWHQLDRWVGALQSVFPEVAPRLPRAQVECWQALLDSVDLIRAGRAGEIDYVRLERLGRP